MTVLHVGVSACIEEDLNTLDIAPFDCKKESCLSAIIRVIYLSRQGNRFKRRRP